jgi:DNA-binding transcriptional regulator GbsR (MarR family)
VILLREVGDVYLVRGDHDKGEGRHFFHAVEDVPQTSEKVGNLLNE